LALPKPPDDDPRLCAGADAAHLMKATGETSHPSNRHKIERIKAGTDTIGDALHDIE
jgi:hypothetical protein